MPAVSVRPPRVTSLAAMVLAVSRQVTKSAVHAMKRHDMAVRSYYGAVDDRPARSGRLERIGRASFLKALAAQHARVADPAGPAVLRFVATPCPSRIDAEPEGTLDNFGLGELQERGMHTEASRTLDAGFRCEVRHPLECFDVSAHPSENFCAL